jgi:hypothetical protein
VELPAWDGKEDTLLTADDMGRDTDLWLSEQFVTFRTQWQVVFGKRNIKKQDPKTTSRDRG